MNKKLLLSQVKENFCKRLSRIKATQAQTQTAKTHSTYQAFDQNLSLGIDVMVSIKQACWNVAGGLFVGNVGAASGKTLSSSHSRERRWREM